MTEPRDDIDTLLAADESYLDDGGFTDTVASRLPRRAGRRAGLRLAVLSIATLLAAAVGIVVLPIGALVESLATLSAGGWAAPTFIAGAVSLAVVIWAAATPLAWLPCLASSRCRATYSRCAIRG